MSKNRVNVLTVLKRKGVMVKSLIVWYQIKLESTRLINV